MHTLVVMSVGVDKGQKMGVHNFKMFDHLLVSFDPRKKKQ